MNTEGDRNGSVDDDDIVLADLSDDELVEQMHDDLDDGMKDEIEAGTRSLLEPGRCRLTWAVSASHRHFPAPTDGRRERTEVSAWMQFFT